MKLLLLGKQCGFSSSQLMVTSVLYENELKIHYSFLFSAHYHQNWLQFKTITSSYLVYFENTSYGLLRSIWEVFSRGRADSAAAGWTGLHWPQRQWFQRMKTIEISATKKTVWVNALCPKISTVLNICLHNREKKLFLICLFFLFSFDLTSKHILWTCMHHKHLIALLRQLDATNTTKKP